MTHAAARKVLGSASERIVTLQGFLYLDKGHRLLAQALPLLPPEVKVVFAGGPSAGPAGHLLSMIHDLVLGLLKTAGFTNAAQGRRWFDGHLQQAFALLISGWALA